MENITEPDTMKPPTSTAQVQAIASLVQNPTVLILMLMLLGGQGADLFQSSNSSAEIRELRDDVQQAVGQLTDHSERIGRLEVRFNDAGRQAEETRELVRDVQDRVSQLVRSAD